MAPLPQAFKAAIMPALGGRHVIVDRSLAPLAPDEVAIKVTASAVNPLDWMMRDLGFGVAGWPAALGQDGAGKIAAVGADVAGLAVGDRVFFEAVMGDQDAATFRQYVRMPAALVAGTPDGLSDDEAAVVALAALTAAVGLYHDTGAGLAPPAWDLGGAGVGAGRALLVVGGSSSVGEHVIQLARLSGFERVIATASPVHADRLRRLGAHVVLDRATATPETVRDAAAGVPLALAYDTISTRETQLFAVRALQQQPQQPSQPQPAQSPPTGAGPARVVTVLGVAEEAAILGWAREPRVELGFIAGIGSLAAVRPLAERVLRALGGPDGWLATGRVVPNVVEVVPGGLAGLDAALDRKKQGVSGVKLVVRPQETR